MKRLFFLLTVGSLFLFASCSYEDVEVTNFSNYSIKKANSEGFDLHLDLTINNPNRYKMTMKWAKMDVYLNNKYIGKTAIEEPLTLAKKSENQYPVVLHTTYDEAFKGNVLNLIASAIFGSGIKLKVEGEMKGSVFLFSKKYPIEHTEKLNLSDLSY
jgi:LEA14-like dessication related protein